MATANSQRRPGLLRRLGLLGCLAGALGLALLAAAYLHNGERWELARAPLPLAAGSEVEVAVTPELDEPCEIEIELESAGLPQAWLDEVFAQEKPSRLAVEWEARAGDNVVAHGDARDYLYVRNSNSSFAAQTAFRLLNIAGHKPRGGTVGRGVGRLPCRAGESYRVQARVGDMGGELDGARAFLVVRVNRAKGDRALRESYPLFATAAALVALALGLFALQLWTGRRVSTKA